jgi:hypothetical protein
MKAAIAQAPAAPGIAPACTFFFCGLEIQNALLPTHVLS